MTALAASRSQLQARNVTVSEASQVWWQSEKGCSQNKMSILISKNIKDEEAKQAIYEEVLQATQQTVKRMLVS